MAAKSSVPGQVLPLSALSGIIFRTYAIVALNQYMAHKKAGGSAKNLNDSNAQYLGVKLFAGQIAKQGAIIVRQRGTKMVPGKNVGLGKDHTIFSLINGIVSFRPIRKTSFAGKMVIRSAVDVTLAK